jgi:hypothetical protein
MSRKQRAGGGKRDTAEKGIVDALEAAGARVWKLGGTGNPDLLVLFQGVYVPLEVKTGKGLRTANQTDIPWSLVRTIPEAMAAMLAAGAAGFSRPR